MTVGHMYHNAVSFSLNQCQ